MNLPWLAAWALLSSPAPAHVDGTIAAFDLQLGPTILLETSFGLVLGTDQDWRWTCHEAITGPGAVLSPRYVRLESGVILGLVSDLSQAREAGQALYRSPDGCSWDPPKGLDGHPITQLSLAQGGALAGSADGVLLRSGDDGQSWEPVADSGGLPVRSLLSQGALSWGTASDGSREHLLLRSEDGGLSWDRVGIDPLVNGEADLAEPRLLALAPTGAEAWLVSDVLGGDSLWRSRDGGETWQQVLQAEGEFVDGAYDDAGGLWLVEASRTAWYAAPGEDPAPVAGSLPPVGLTAAGDEAWLAFYAEFTGLLLGRGSFDGAATGFGPDGLQTVLRPQDIDGALTCRDGSQGREICLPLWAGLEKNLQGYAGGTDSGDGGGEGDGGDPDGGGTGAGDSGPPPSDGEGCQCGSSGPIGILAALLPAALLRRIRRQRRPAP